VSTRHGRFGGGGTGIEVLIKSGKKKDEKEGQSEQRGERISFEFLKSSSLPLQTLGRTKRFENNVLHTPGEKKKTRDYSEQGRGEWGVSFGLCGGVASRYPMTRG